MEKSKKRLGEREKELEILKLISSAVNSSLEIEEVLGKIVEVTVRATQCDSCLIYLYNSKERCLILRASKNPHPGMIGSVSLRLGEGITGWVAANQKPVVIEKEAGKDPRFKFVPGLPEDKYKAFLSYPIIFKGELVGVINVQYEKGWKHKPTTLSLMETISNQVGGAIVNARLYQELKEKAEVIETLKDLSQTVVSKHYLDEILSLIVVMAARLVKAEVCSILLLEEKEGKLVLKATQSASPAYRLKPPVKVESSVSGRAIKTGKPVVVKDLLKDKDFSFPELAKKENLKSLLSVPLIYQGKAIGAVNVYTSNLTDFSKDEINIVQVVANQAAIAIERTRLLKEASKAQEALETRKALDKAKAFLIKNLGLTEEEAHKLIYRKSMDLRKPLKEVAETIASVLPEVLKPAGRK